MHIPTGDYVVEFLDFRGDVMPGTLMAAATYHEAEQRALNGAGMVGAHSYRILRCMANSTDKSRERWECD